MVHFQRDPREIAAQGPPRPRPALGRGDAEVVGRYKDAVRSGEFEATWREATRWAAAHGQSVTASLVAAMVACAQEAQAAETPTRDGADGTGNSPLQRGFGA